MRRSSSPRFQRCSATGVNRQSSSWRFVNSSRSTLTSIRARAYPRWIGSFGSPSSDSGPDGSPVSPSSSPKPWSDGTLRAFGATGVLSQRRDPDALPSRQSFANSYTASPTTTLGAPEGSMPSSRNWGSPSASQLSLVSSRNEGAAMTSASDGPRSCEIIATRSRRWTFSSSR